ncbi:alanine dehydrogenase [bacterium (Candidatus Blackallbacteria) CG17_big_fil_post_rev_8_21_14_2_50_48_46]|uniref:Alanine dehydrogenase n=1 Tax=bacterium (Candidatus Blackallbacteria) CG17_big_fil_post_rev_8_21_14_2_50_48_46 TaxID=2014261 RepID=A0A2M7G9W8_9BACT|nr:MAG: alanine dehydrogenase [bacterium (Candidatus Blackallbacteria) CG18_big_fil_WC_8_21_14_2_50_49_26]PIW18935.1 MAG: alanine dehydrogenase [bacterium (Candidatus Blackallbacteria) CG17_big_fil_post_rev_8_21_14_2_50_48_46]PIW44698.1 MAG: alanine dehydrogenase [bacterium (Candidatus Blackallbacteria) CG13_big_fil_rev_8_21_14_2_50_49_14]
MKVGIPKEIKDHEYRVAITPSGVQAFQAQGHEVFIENNAGLGSTFTNEDYHQAGATIVDSADEIFAKADMILKVKEPQQEECGKLRENQLLFTYLHLAADRELTANVKKSGCIAIAYETIQMPNGSLPLLTPMSEIAGRMSVQIGAQYLEKRNGGRGVLMGGVSGVPSANVVILGGGVTGTQAAKVALGMGAFVTIVDRNIDRLRYLDDILEGRFETVASDIGSIARSVSFADLLVGAVLIPGAKAPTLVSEEMVKTMKEGSVIVDISIDQGGCVETIKPTSHSNPTYVKHGVIHYGVTNMPGAVPRTSTYALTNSTLPYALQLAAKGYPAALENNQPLRHGVNIERGRIVHPVVADAFPDLA